MVTPIAGNQADIAIALQSAQGAAAAASQFRMYLTGGGVGVDKVTQDIEETTADRLRSEAFVSRASMAGAPAMVVRPSFVGLLLYAALGAKAVTGVADPWTHTFTPASTLPYLTIWRRIGPSAAGGLYEKFVDCKVAQLVFNSQAGGLLLVTATFMGINAQSKTAAEVTVTVETTNSFIHADGVGALKIEGVAVASVEQFGLTINNNAVLQQGDSVAGYAITEAMLAIEASTTHLVEDFGLWNRFVYGSATPADGTGPSRNILELAGAPAGLDFKWTRPGAPARSLEFLLPRVEAIPATIEPNVNGEPLKYSTTYRVKKPAAGAGISAILVNGVSAYAA